MANGEANGFSDEELRALLLDATVTPGAIVSEMQDAGAESLPTDAIERAREALADLSEAKVALIATLPPRLRSLVLEEALGRQATGLAQALAASNDKALAKEGKRLVHILKTRGVKIEAPKPAPVPARETAPAEELPTFMSNVLGDGERVLLFLKPARLGVDVAQVVVSDGTGVVSARLAELGRREYRKFVQSLSGSGALVIGEVPRAYARGLVTRALDVAARANRAVPRGLHDVAFVLGPSVPPSPSPGRSLALPDDAPTFARRAPELLAHADLHTWLPVESHLRGLAQKVEEISASELYVDDEQRQRAVREAIDAAVRGFWTAERRRLYAERLFDDAFLFHAAGRPDHANIALACAAELDSERDLEAVGFCYAFFEKLLPALQGKAQPAPEPTSPGGLVLP